MTVTCEPSLGDKMRDLAKSQTAVTAMKLVAAADLFEESAKGFYASPQTCDVKTFMGNWAKARRLYSEISGEPLI